MHPQNSCNITYPRDIVCSRYVRPLGKPRCRWEDNIKIDLQEVGWGGMDWIGLAQDTNRWQVFVNTVMDMVHKMLGPS
jgi:hypothetical protein